MVSIFPKQHGPHHTEHKLTSLLRFVEHLEKVNLDRADVPTTQDIGRKLTRMLQEEALIEAWWAPERMYMVRFFVFGDYSKDLVRYLHQILKDSTVQKGLSDMPSERQWVVRVTAKEEPSFELYSKVTQVMARWWFESPAEKLSCFVWLYGYMISVRLHAHQSLVHRLTARPAERNHTGLGGHHSRKPCR